MSGITNLSRTSNKAILEAAVLLALAVAAIVIIHAFQHVSADSPNPGHSAVLNSNSTTGSSTDPTSADNSSGDSSNSNTTTVTVNGQDVPVPQNGATSQTISNDGGSATQVDTSNQESSSNGSGAATNKSTTSINVSSTSSTSSNQGGDQ